MKKQAKKILIVSPKNRSVYNFRGELIRELLRLGYEITVTCPNNTDIEKVEKLGVKVKIIPLKKDSINPFSDLKYLSSLTKLMKKENPHIVFCYTQKPSVYGTWAAKKAGIKNVFPMITGLGYAFSASTLRSKVARAVLIRLYKANFKQAKKVIFQNSSDLNEFVSRGFVEKEKAVTVNGSGVDMKKFPKSPLPKEITFLSVARLKGSKGVKEYLAACEIIKEKYPHVKCVLVGEQGEGGDEIPFNEIKPYITKKIIEYSSGTSNILPFYQSCSVYVLPSYREGVPRSTLEAMSCGRPIITTDAPGCRETVAESLNGFKVPVKNVQAIAEKMELLINNPTLLLQMGEESHKLCAQRFDVGTVNKQMLSVFDVV